MRFKTIRLGLLAAIAAATFSISAFAAGDYPINKPVEQEWTFAGLFGRYDQAQLQRGFKVYREVCQACHSLEYVAFRNLIGEEGLWFTEDEVKAIAAEYEVEDGPDDDGEMVTQPAKPADHFPLVFANDKAAAAANNGAIPPDFSLLAKARAVGRGFPTFVFDLFTQYQEGGADYIYALLTGYSEAPDGTEVNEGTYYNPYYIGGNALAMAQPIYEGDVTYDDGSPETVEQYSRDVTAFMMWAAEPKLLARKKLGFKVLIYLLIFAGLMYAVKRRIWAKVGH